MIALSAYLQIWRLKLSHTMMVTAAFHFFSERPSVRQKSTTTMAFYRSVQPLLILGKKLDRFLTFRHYQVALRKKTIFARHTAEATCKLGMVPKHYAQLSYLWSTQQLSTSPQSGVAVLTLAS